MVVALLGASHAELPLVRAAHRHGIEVVAISGDPAGLAVSEVDEFIECDYSNIDDVRSLCGRLGPTAVIAGCNDFAAITASHVALELGLPGHDRPEVARAIHLKDEFRALAARADVRVPNFVRFDDVPGARAHVDASPRAVLVKPNDMTGGKGISRVGVGESPVEAIESAFRISRSGRIVVEDFIDGSLHSAAIVLRGARVKFLQLADERSLDDPYLVSAAQMPSKLGSRVEQEVCGWVERIATTLGCVDGLIHVQFIHDGDQPWMIEMCRRPPGDLYLDLVRLATGVDLSALYVEQCLGLSSDIAQSPTTVPTLRQCITSDHDGSVKKVEYSEELQRAIVESTDLRRLPTTITEHRRQKIRIVQAQFESQAEMEVVASVPRVHFSVS